MRTITGARTHLEIQALIDRAERWVVLISPFVRPWDDLNRAIARAVARGVNVRLITRHEARDEGSQLWVFEALELEVRRVPDMHLKAYLSDKEAIHTSANLAQSAVDRAVESAIHFEREDEGWLHVWEIWQQAEDERTRHEHAEEWDIMEALESPDRFASDSFCIQCGKPAGESDWACRACRASAIADRLDAFEDAIVCRACVDCGAKWATSFEKPRCRTCWQARLASTRRSAPTWFAHGERAHVQAWLSRPARRSGFHADVDAVAKAMRTRISVWMPEAAALRAEVISLGRGAFELPLLPFPGDEPGKRADAKTLAQLQHLTVERLARNLLPAHAELRDFSLEQGRYYSVRVDETGPHWSHWQSEEPLAAWDLPLRGAEAGHSGPRPWFWPAFLGPRAKFPEAELPEPNRVHLGCALEITAPAEERGRWPEIAEQVLEVMLASLHRYEPEEVRQRFGGPTDDEGTRVVVAMLQRPAPMGAISIPGMMNGRAARLPGRRDRLVALRVVIRDGEAWHLRGWISRVTRARAN